MVILYRECIYPGAVGIENAHQSSDLEIQYLVSILSTRKNLLLCSGFFQFCMVKGTVYLLRVQQTGSSHWIDWIFSESVQILNQTKPPSQDDRKHVSGSHLHGNSLISFHLQPLRLLRYFSVFSVSYQDLISSNSFVRFDVECKGAEFSSNDSHSLNLRLESIHWIPLASGRPVRPKITCPEHKRAISLFKAKRLLIC